MISKFGIKAKIPMTEKVRKHNEYFYWLIEREIPPFLILLYFLSQNMCQRPFVQGLPRKRAGTFCEDRHLNCSV